MAASGAARLRAAARGRAALEDHLASAEFDPEEFTPADHAALAGAWSWLGEVAGQAQEGGQGGMVDDELSYVAPWGVDPGQVRAPVLLLHGGQDRAVPSSHATWLASRIPSAELWLRPDDGTSRSSTPPRRPWAGLESTPMLGLGAAVSAALLTARTVGLPGGYSEAGSPEANISLAVQLAFCGLAAFQFGQQHRSSRLAWYAPGGRYACWGGAPMDWDRRLAVRAVRALLGAALAIVLLAPTALAVNIGAAGDIADRPGGNRNHFATANLLGANAVNLVLALGDNQYPCGELQFYQDAYHLSWGRYRSITRPAPGNHEYLNHPDLCVDPQPNAEGYYTYFEGRTPAHPGYYSFDYQGWHFVVLNTTCGAVPGGCSGAMLTWLKADLAANRDHRCTVVYGHHPYQSSAFPFYGTPELKAIWPTLVVEDVDLFLAGHNHGYERLGPMRTGGVPDSDWGPGDGDDGHAGVPIVVAGTGGRSLYSVTRVHPQSQARLRSYGIFKLVPNYPAADQWVQAFKTTSGGTYDRKTFRCH